MNRNFDTSRTLTLPIPKSAFVPVLFFAALTAVTARIVIPLPFTPVPITLQVLAVLLSGLILGSRGGAASQILYLAAVFAGLPATSSGLGGPAVFVMPTAGYLIAFVPAAWMAGYLSERLPAQGRASWLTPFVASVCAVLVIYAGGVAWLAVLLGGLSIAIRQGLLPFIPVDLAKAVVAAIVTSGGRLWFDRR